MSLALRRLKEVIDWRPHAMTVRDYLLYGSGNSCLLDVPLKQKGALKKFAGKRIRLVCGGKSNRYSGRFYYAKPIS
jgi:hypothetical protein